MSIDRSPLTAPHHWSDSMRIQRVTTSQFSVLLLEPDLQSAVQIALQLEAAGFPVHVEADAYSALRALQKSFFLALVVVADLADKDCLVTLKALRRNAPRSWMIVAVPYCDVHAYALIHRCGGDACIASPISADELIERLEAFQMRARPLF